MATNPRLIAFAILGIFFSVPVFLFAANQVKTTHTFITSGDGAVSVATSTTFSLYIGDNLSGVTTPVKSVEVLVSGVFTTSGGGPYTVAVQVDSGTTKTFTMANVSTTPTPFELLYDASGTIAPTSAGTYSYTLTVTPTNVTVYGLGAKLLETHEYVPDSCPDGQPANEKIKTTHTFITSGDGAVSVATSTTFSLYIGDNLSGVTTPVKSVEVLVSGVFTTSGGGPFTIAVDVDGASAQTYTMPNVGTTPTPFELRYDASGTVTPTSAGTYSYTLNTTPTNVTVYGLGAVVDLTHRYKPPACGGFAATGYVESSTFDTGIAGGAAYNWISWSGPALPANTRVKLQLATSNCANGKTNPPACDDLGTWQYYGDTNGDGTCGTTEYYEPLPNVPAEIKCLATHNNQRYFRYKATLCSVSDCTTGTGSATPQISGTSPYNGIIVNWSP